jgi:hypothetical protein
MADFVAGVAEALTDARTVPLAAVAERMSVLQQLVADAETTEVLLILCVPRIPSMALTSRVALPAVRR